MDCYLTETEIKRETATDRFMVTALAFVDDMHREQSRQRTRDALHRKASRGHVAGGITYGYRNREITRPGADGRPVRDHVVREIHPEQADVIRRIFTMAADGLGFSRIAKRLNAEAVPCPRGPRGWATSGVREMLLRDLYRGRVVWGKTRWADKGGTKVKVDVPANEWLVREAPELRIVPEAMWRAAHARLDGSRDAYRRATHGYFAGMARTIDRGAARYLFSGLLSCSVCGGVMHGTNRTGTRARPRRYYVCATHRERGETLCHNWMAAPVEALHESILGALQRTVLAPDLIEDVIARTLQLRATRQADLVRRRPDLEAELRRVEAELRRYAEAIATTGPLPSLLDQVRTRESRCGDLRAQIEQMGGARPAVGQERTLVREIRARLTDWRALLEREAIEARTLVLKPLFPERIILTPHRRPEGRFYEYAGTPSYGGLIAGLIGHGGRAVTVVPPG